MDLGKLFFDDVDRRGNTSYLLINRITGNGKLTSSVASQKISGVLSTLSSLLKARRMSSKFAAACDRFSELQHGVNGSSEDNSSSEQCSQRDVFSTEDQGSAEMTHGCMLSFILKAEGLDKINAKRGSQKSHCATAG